MLGKKEKYSFLEILEEENIKQVKMKEKRKDYLTITRKLIESKICGKDHIKGIRI